ncbi:MAG TPA: hypothetical protein VGF28_05505 [Thermoanaerobaculia bacterium]|jgi:hypothetical protein
MRRKGGKKARHTLQRGRVVSATDGEQKRVRRVQMFVDPFDVNPLGGVQPSELRAAAFSPQQPAAPELDAPEFNIAFESVTSALATRSANVLAANDPKLRAVFIITDRPRDLGEAVGAEPELFLNNGSRRLVGNIWIAGPSMSSGYYLELLGESSADLQQALVSRGLGDKAAFVFDPTATVPELRYYPRGVDDADTVHRFSFAASSFSLEALDEIMSEFYDDSLKTPEAGGTEFTPWAKSSAYIPRKRTEVFIQGWLRSILKARLRNCEIHAEIPTDEGRADLLIVSKSASLNSWIYHAVLELKVLRSVTSTKSAVPPGEREQAVCEGILQAIAYQKKLAPSVAMLCCYDMTKPEHCIGDACFAPVLRKAKAWHVQLRHYRIFGSSKDLRNAQYGDDSTPKSRPRKHKKRL